MEVQKVLKIYEDATSQGTSKHKSGVFFSSNTKATEITSILNLLGVSTCNSKEEYFGLPMVIGINKYHTCEWIKDQV